MAKSPSSVDGTADAPQPDVAEVAAPVSDQPAALVIAADAPEAEPVAVGESGDVSFATEACGTRLDEMANLVAAMTPADRKAVKAALTAFAKTL